jgi:hypothetical protein
MCGVLELDLSGFATHQDLITAIREAKFVRYQNTNNFTLEPVQQG